MYKTVLERWNGCAGLVVKAYDDGSVYKWGFRVVRLLAKEDVQRCFGMLLPMFYLDDGQPVLVVQQLETCEFCGELVDTRDLRENHGICNACVSRIPLLAGLPGDGKSNGQCFTSYATDRASLLAGRWRVDLCSEPLPEGTIIWTGALVEEVFHTLPF